jgi:protein tyrosine/serine phosphatase
MALATDKLETAREFIPNLRVVAPDIVRGGFPDTGGLHALQKAGVRTIICLSGGSTLVGLFRPAGANVENRETAQERATVTKLGLNFVSIPMDVFGTVSEQVIEHFLSTITDPDNRPAFIHCLHGRDRTGLMTGVYRVACEQWSADRAYAEMLECGFDMSRTNLSDALFALAKRRGCVDKSTG